MIFVTGGTGLVGSYLLAELCRKGYDVRALKRKNASLALVERIFSYSSEKIFLDSVEWVDGDVLDVCSLKEAMLDVKYVYHCAAIVSFSPDDADEMMRVNAEGTANVVNVALESAIKKLCYVSSIATLGRADQGGYTDEETHWKDSVNNSGYSKSKYRAENEVWRAAEEGLDVVIVNPSVIIGSGDWSKGSSALINTVWKGLKFYTKGMNGFVDVRDVAQIMVQLVDSKVKNERFVLSSENVLYKDFFFKVANALQKPPPPYFAGPMLSAIGWRFEIIRSLFTGRKPVITKSTARTANNLYRYSSEKLKSLMKFEFISIDKSIEDVCEKYLSEINDENIR